MPGTLQVSCRDVYGEVPRGVLTVSLEHTTLSLKRVATLSGEHAAEFVDLPTRPQGIYRLALSSRSYQPTSRFIELVEDLTALMITLALKPDAVKGIAISDAPDAVANQFPAWTSEQRAAFLNIRAKSQATAFSNGRTVWGAVEDIREIHPDRIFVRVASWLIGELDGNPIFTRVSGALHAPPHGYEFVESFKTLDPYGNLQVTLFSNGVQWIADIDIDDAAGIEHLFQVARNTLTGSPTHPYAIHEILVAQGIDPGYRLQV